MSPLPNPETTNPGQIILIVFICSSESLAGSSKSHLTGIGSWWRHWGFRDSEIQLQSVEPMGNRLQSKQHAHTIQPTPTPKAPESNWSRKHKWTSELASFENWVHPSAEVSLSWLGEQCSRPTMNQLLSKFLFTEETTPAGNILASPPLLQGRFLYQEFRLPWNRTHSCLNTAGYTSHSLTCLFLSLIHNTPFYYCSPTISQIEMQLSSSWLS